MILSLPFLFGVGGMLLAFIIFSEKTNARNHEKQLRLQAEKRNAKVLYQVGSYKRFLPHLDFLDEGGLVEVLIFPSGFCSQRCTWMVLSQIQSLRENTFFIHGKNKTPGYAKKMPVIPMDDPAFNAIFVVRGDHEDFIREFLTQEIKGRMIALKDYGPVLQMVNNSALLKIICSAKDEYLFDQLIDTGLAAIRQARKMMA